MMAWVVAVLLRALIFTLVWGSLAGAAPEYAIYGVVAVVAATGFSLVLLPPRRSVQIGGWPRRVWYTLVLVAWFIGRSAVGGVDVAVRAMKKRVDIAPAVVRAPLLLPDGHGRQVALLMMNLMPGSMVQRVITRSGVDADLTGHTADDIATTVELHTLSESLQPAQQWAQLQHRVAAATGTRI